MDIEGITTDVQILRRGMEEELKAVNLYEALSKIAKSAKVKKLLLDIAREEKVHIGEFETILEILDKQHESAEEEGEKEVKKTTESTLIDAIERILI